MGPIKYEIVVRYLFLILACIFQGISLDLRGRDVIDLLQALNASQPLGHSYTSGHNNTPVLVLEDSARYLKLPEQVLTRALKFMKENNEITFLATVRQEVGDSGSIIAFSSDIIRFLELESSGRRNELRFHYTHDQQVQVETFPYRLADNMWHKLALSLSGTRVTILVNCSKIYERVIKSVDKEFTAGKLSLFIGQRNGQHALFRGALQDVKIITQAHGYLLQCPLHNTDCPTCAQYQDLEAKVEQMYTLYENLSVKLLQAEERLTDLEKCECQKNCYDNLTVHKEGEVWSLDQCTLCDCMNGSINCKKLDCPGVSCKHPVYKEGECCPVCLNDCYYLGEYYDHGESSIPRPCVICMCNDGNMICEKEDSCPPLNCSEEDQLSVQGECCPVCRGTDFCSQGHDCHVNATCVNLDTRYACQCKAGFHGDGRECEDVDECLTEGGRNGHHCHGNTFCVNTIGAYRCQCAGGHKKGSSEDSSDDLCEDVDECASEVHTCGEHAVCVNTVGSYVCQCQAGYTIQGGQLCQPSCSGQCQNGGHCIAPDTCSCRHGYMGPFCEIDVDECNLAIATCGPHSVCVNLPGWYHCQCEEGYRSLWTDNQYGRLCLDINECSGEGDGHTCHSSLTCENTDGGYRCQCPHPRGNCVFSCVYDGEEHESGTNWTHTEEPCTQCICQAGVMACQRKACDCNSPTVDYKCCPHCDLNSQCNHQELPLLLQNGDQWLFQCQICECLGGEIDCWPMDCPTVTCQSQVQLPGDCCPRCAEDNPCLLDQSVGGVDLSQSSCVYKQFTYPNSQVWTLDNDPCTFCECKAGHICCAFNQTCV